MHAHGHFGDRTAFVVMAAMILWMTSGLQAQQRSESAAGTVSAHGGEEHAALRQLSNSEFLAAWELRDVPRFNAIDPAARSGKCGFDFTLESIRRLPTFTAAERARMDAVLAPQRMDTSILSPSGRFRVHFDLSGVNTPAMIASGARIPGTAVQYATQVAAFFDESYEIEVNQRGYTAPPFVPGSLAHDIYIIEYYRTDYGRTIQIQQVPSSTARPCFTTYIEVDNDFLGYPTEGLDAARVTAAHEFHHMVQLGSYGSWDNDLFFYEMTSTYFEDVVYPGVNDYLFYLRDFFLYPDRALYAWRGYEAVLWLKMLDAHFEPAIVRLFWEEMRRQDPLSAMEAVLRSSRYQSDIGTEYCRFSRWNWHTGDRASAASMSDRYPRAELYPKMQLQNAVALVGTQAVLSGAVLPLAANYVLARRAADTAIFVVANTDVYSAIRKAANTVGYTFDVRTLDPGSYIPLDNGLWYRFIPNDGNLLCHSTFSTAPLADVSRHPFPNPYDPARDGIIRFPVSSLEPALWGTLTIHTVALDLVRSYNKLTIRGDDAFGRYVAWDGTDERGDYVASGIYLYSLDLGGTVTTGKIAIVRK